jgi:Tfp pilus assembly PilM family ATPase
MKSTYYVGFSFLRGKIQLAEVEHKKRKSIVTVLAERDTIIDFARSGATISADHPQLNMFIKELKEMMKQHKVSTEYVSFALPPDPLFINIIPVSPGLTGKALSEYLQWEVDQYFPHASPREFIVDSHGLPLEHTGAQQTFMVAVRRGMVAFLQKAVVGLNMKLNIIDIDQFSTEKTLITNYPEILEHDIVLIGLRHGGIDASLIHNGQMTDYRSFLYNNEPYPDKYILEYLKYLKQKDDSTPAALLLHGIDVTKSLVVSLRTSSGIKQTLALNPFRKLVTTKHLNPSFIKDGYRFSAAIGLALRTK